MKISFDTDGTMTDYSEFVFTVARKYFNKKHAMSIVNPKALEIEDVFDIKNTLIGRGISETSAIKETQYIMERFWISHRFVRFTLLMRFRKGISRYIRDLRRQGHYVSVDSSRSKTVAKGALGVIVRSFTLVQYAINGCRFRRKEISFYENDIEKTKGIEAKGADILFDDKPEVIIAASGFANVVCVNAPYNACFQFPDNVIRINGFENGEPEEAVRKLVGEKKYTYMLREAKAKSTYNLLIKTFAPVVLKKFRPILFNTANILDTTEPVIYAPNHRSTLDPFIILAVLKKPIFWAALLRFFTGEDSIFNNSKNPILCKITSIVFRKLEFFPIDRKSDNPNAQNYQAIKDMNGFLNIGCSIGIFGEGTTLKEPETKDFNRFDTSFLLLAKRSNAWVQPVTTLWIKGLKIKQKVMLNFGEAFRIGNLSIKEAMSKFLYIQKQSLNEMKIAKEQLYFPKQPNSATYLKSVFGGKNNESL
jgi:1-acyl-sn-glycerol-3-phosphate acyltransferase